MEEKLHKLSHLSIAWDELIYYGDTSETKVDIVFAVACRALLIFFRCDML